MTSMTTAAFEQLVEEYDLEAKPATRQNNRGVEI